MTELRDKILETIVEVANLRGAELRQPVEDSTVLLDSGLDSLGFAIVIARLEEDLGYDPFLIMVEAVYPRTLGELVRIYEVHRPS